MSHQANMNTMPGIGLAAGGQMPNMGTPSNSNAPSDDKSYKLKLHTYIYDYFLKTGEFGLARALHDTLEIQHSTQPKQSPDQKGVNGVHDSDKKGRPDDLPLPEVPGTNLDSPFLFDWWCQFWDLFGAQRGKGNAATKQYLNNVQTRMSNQQRMMRMDPQMQANMGMRNGMMPGNGMAVTNDMAKRMAMQNRQPTPQQLQQMQQFRMQQMQLQQTQMQREGSTIDMNGQQRPQSPGSIADAPSPKRQRMDGTFNGPIGPMGRGQPQGMPGQQFNGIQMQNPQAKAMQQGMPGNPPGLPQGSPAMDATNPDFFNASRMNAMPGQGPPNNNSNHALQDYQMQLMLLEQQNKKRLLMARQEQDNMTNPPGGPAPPGQPGAFAPVMSPSGSRAGGPSPNANDGMKRGTPKMAHGAVPSPTPDGPMAQGRASPAPGFDPSQMGPNMPPGMFPQMNKMGMMGPNGQIMQPPSSHPGFNPQMNQQQMEMYRAQQQNGTRLPNGAFMGQGGPPQMMPGQQTGLQQPPNMTPQQRNAMPPPPAPTGDAGRGTQPSSPQQQQPAPPTPQQSNKANPKGRKDNKNTKKAPAKKGTGATPASEDAPPTPTPAPPITPTQANANFPPNKNGPGQQSAPQPPAPNAMPPQIQPDMGVPFGHLDGSDFNTFNLDLGGMDGNDVLDNFDFDSFLTNGDGDGAFGFDASMAFGDSGLEAGGEM